MSEEFEALKRIESICENYEKGFVVVKSNKKGLAKMKNDLSLIKDGLKRLDKYENKKIVGTTTLDKALEDFAISCSPTTQKKLKALEIIKRKRVDISDLIHSKNLIDYNDGRDRKLYLTQEEFDLLKEYFYEKN